MRFLLLALAAAAFLATRAEAKCAPTNMTVTQKVAARLKDVDKNGDGILASTELGADFATNFDADGNGLITSNEFKARWTCAYGDYRDFARYVFANISHGHHSINISSRASSGNFSKSKAQFLAYETERYANFAKSQAFCQPKNITVDEKMVEFEKYNDHDGNGFVTSDDIIWDLRTNFDKNGDDKVTYEEFTANYMCVYGDTRGMANFVWNDLTGGVKHATLTPASFQVPPFNTTGIPIKDFLATARARYTNYNGGCLPKTTPLEQKLRINGHYNDIDGNGKVTEADVAFDLNNRYDFNRDGVVTEQEWVDRWSCAFGDTEQFARFVWDQLTQDADSVATNSFAGEPFSSGIPLDEFIATNRGRYEHFATIG